MALTDSLISWWSLDEASGTRADSHGSNDLTDNNTVGSATGIVGDAASFVAANNEFLTRADNASLSTGNIDFTFAFWVNSPGTSEGFLGKRANLSSTEYQIYRSAGTWKFDVYSGGLVGVTESATAATGWCFVVGWHDSVNDTINIQINNNTAASSSHSGGTQDSTAGFVIGNISSTTNVSACDSEIDEVAFWKRVLTVDERTALYNSGNGVSYADISGGGASAVPAIMASYRRRRSA